VVTGQMRYTITDRVARRALIAILALYLLLGLQFAFGTPLWQVPDEPAHYTYVQHIAENGRLPELREGDYPHDYLEAAKGVRFADTDISPIRYESHQPPLYYLLMTPVYLAAQAVRWHPAYAIRVVSLLLGGVALLLGYHVARRIFPRDPRIALGATALAAVLPMHLTMVAAVNNDVLAELMIAAVALQLVAPSAQRWTWRRAVLLGLTLGLAALTKLQSYVAFALVAAALAWDASSRRQRDGALRPMRALALGAVMLGIAIVVVAPWLLRNASLYGWGDLLGLQRHDQVVVGQLTTGEFLRANGVRALLVGFLRTSFQSFWGQFGWMGVVLHPRVYLVAALLCGLVALGIVGALWRIFRARVPLEASQVRGLLLLAVWGLVTLAGYLWWNVSYVQHQGRYLFPALVPLGAAFAIGLRELFTGSPKLPLGALVATLLILVAEALLGGDLRAFATALVVGAACLLLVANWCERRAPGAMMACTYLGIAAFGLYCLYGYVIPLLSP